MYPERLLPTIAKKTEIEQLDISNYFLVRFTTNSEDTWIQIGDTEILNDAYLNLIKVQGNSCHLHHPKSDLDYCKHCKDVKIEVSDNDLTYTSFTDNEDKVPSADEVQYNIIDERGMYFLPINKINRFPIPVEVEMGRIVEIRDCLIKYKYSPNLVNICHFDLNCHKIDEEEPIPLKAKGLWIKKLKHDLREHLQNTALNIREIEAIYEN